MKHLPEFAWMIRVASMLALFASLIGLGDRAEARPIAIVVDVIGDIDIVKPQGSERVKLLTDIDDGASADMTAESSVSVMYLTDGSEYTIGGRGTVAFRSGGPQPSAGQAVRRRSQQRPFQDRVLIAPTTRAQAGTVLRGQPSPLRIYAIAANGATVSTSTPLLEWTEPVPGLSYLVEVLRSGDVIHTATSIGSSYLIPAATGLQPGRDYEWRVSAHLPDGRRLSTASSFTIADRGLQQAVEAVKSDTDGSIASRVVLALWLQANGLLDEARKTWRDIATERPNQPKIESFARRLD